MEAVGSRTSRACDACKKRKVRCDGKPGCAQCVHLNLRCLYSVINISARARKNITRGAVINAIKGSSSPGTEPHALLAPRFSPASPSKPTGPASEQLLDRSLLRHLACSYAERVFPWLPIIPESDFFAAIDAVNPSAESEALIHALAAVTMNLTCVGPAHSPENIGMITQLYNKSLELRGPVMPTAPITIHSTMIPFLVSHCLFSRHQNVDMVFYYLREALTQFLILRNTQYKRVGAGPFVSKEQMLRLHWTLFVHERFVAINYHHQAELEAPRELPAYEDGIDPRVIEGLHRIIEHYRVIDDDFVHNWLHREASSMTFAWIERKQHELGIDVDRWKDKIEHLSTRQRLDLIFTRYWLHTLIWQMALSKFLLSSAVDEGRHFMSIMFPIELGHRLRSIIATMTPEFIEEHGSGMVQKVFDITVTIADILVYVPAATSDEATARRHLDNFMFLSGFLLEMSNHYHVEEQVLTTKLAALRSRYEALNFTDIDHTG